MEKELVDLRIISSKNRLFVIKREKTKLLFFEKVIFSEVFINDEDLVEADSFSFIFLSGLSILISRLLESFL